MANNDSKLKTLCWNVAENADLSWPTVLKKKEKNPYLVKLLLFEKVVLEYFFSTVKSGPCSEPLNNFI